MRTTGLGAAVVPDVCITATAGSPAKNETPRLGVGASGSDTTTSAPARRWSRSASLSRRSIGTAAAPASRQVCRATTKSSVAGNAIATRSAPWIAPTRAIAAFDSSA